jgi:hypothetical protein
MTWGIIVILAAVIVFAVVLTVRSLTSSTMMAWAMSRDTPAGTELGPSDVHQITVHQGTDDFTVLTSPPAGKLLAHAARRGDVLRPDDLLDGTFVTIPISFKSAAPGLQPGSAVDIYGPAPTVDAVSGAGVPASASGANQLYGRGITVVAVGADGAILVPAKLEGYWVELSTSGVPLTAVLSQGIAVPPGRSYTLGDAERVLAGVADNASGGSTDAAQGSPSPAAGG